MSAEHIYKCDICGRVTSYEERLQITIKALASSNIFEFRDNQSSLYLSKDMCPNCAEKIGIVQKIIKNEKIVNEIKTTSEQLYDVISQIVWENTPQQ